MYKVKMLPIAKKDVREAAKWYNKKQKGLGIRFSKAIRAEFKPIQKNPLGNVNRYKNVHTCVVKRFPFMIHYTVDKSRKIVIIISVFHTKQSPENWNNR